LPPDGYELVAPEGRTGLDAFCSLPGLSALDADEMARHGADRHYLLLDGAGIPVARCSLWWSNPPSFRDERPGLIGHYSALNATAAKVLLEAACEELAARGCSIAIGPIDGSTWRRYRLLTERGSEPPFFLEPDNPDDWPGHFTSVAFSPLAHYFSVLNEHLERRDPRAPELAIRAEEAGISIRQFRRDDFSAELRKLYGLSVRSFRHNLLFTPITEEDFISDYTPIEPFLVPEMVIVAEREGDAAGILFAIPDYLQAQRDEVIDTAILKTIAVHPDWTRMGLGNLLVESCHQALVGLGYRRAIYALMHEDNASLHMASRLGSPIRRYSLFGRALAG
jgi:GNAT superfamily N-acetyltransferase